MKWEAGGGEEEDEGGGEVEEEEVWEVSSSDDMLITLSNRFPLMSPVHFSGTTCHLRVLQFDATALFPTLS